jgi:uncharacterized protein YndB with AHSA1/START domain
MIQAPPDKVFEAMCDLTRHAKWASHDIEIVAGQEGVPAVGHTYTSSHKGKAPDQLSITEMVPNQIVGFHSVMANHWELDFEMTTAPQGDGTVVTCSGKLTKVPLILTPMKLLVAMVGPMGDKKLLNGMKADLEGG